MATKKYTVRNTTNGYRGLNAVSGYVELNPGETRENVEMTDAEYKNAVGTNYFAFGSDATAAGADGEGDDLPSTHKELDKLAADEGVTFSEGTKTVADKQAAITAARGGGSTTPTDGGGAQPDELDKMNDDDLRTTAAAISGKTVDELKDTDRDGLLKLARGQE